MLRLEHFLYILQLLCWTVCDVRNFRALLAPSESVTCRLLSHQGVKVECSTVVFIVIIINMGSVGALSPPIHTLTWTLRKEAHFVILGDPRLIDLFIIEHGS